MKSSLGGVKTIANQNKKVARFSLLFLKRNYLSSLTVLAVSVNEAINPLTF